MAYLKQLVSGGKEIVDSIVQYFSCVYLESVMASDTHDPSGISLCTFKLFSVKLVFFFWL